MITHPETHTRTSGLPDKPVAVNWTITTECNYGCQYCFARFPELTTTPDINRMRLIPALLRDAGCEKLTFVGGEPTLCPYLPELLRISKSCGLTTMVVTNGTTLLDGFLDDNHETIDWIALSIDSQHESIQQFLGRGWGNHVVQTMRCADHIRNLGIRLKVNTVVTRLTYAENMRDLILKLVPDRWKVFQVMKVKGQNDSIIQPLMITASQFDRFRRTHEHLLTKGLNLVFENNALMCGSYVMLDPSGRFFTNRNGYHEYGPSIFDGDCVEKMYWNPRKFIERGGLYEWTIQRSYSIVPG